MGDGSDGQSEVGAQPTGPPRSPPASDPQAGSSPTRAPARSGRWPRTFDSLQSRDFRFFWFGLLAMMGGLQMQMLARAYLVYDLERSASLLAIVSVASAVPILTLSLFGGVVADRIERRKVLQAGQATSAVLATVIAVAIATDTIAWYHLLIAAMVQGAMWAFMMPARQAMIPELVDSHHVTNAVSLSAAAMASTTLVAPAFGGVVYAVAGPEVVYFCIALLSLVAMLLTGQVPETRGSAVGSKGAIFKEIGEGLTYIRGNNLILVLLAVGLATTLFAMPFRFMLPVFIVEVYDRGPESMGIMLGIFGAGSLAGSLFAASIGHWKRGKLLILTSFISGVALVALAALPFFMIAVPLMMLLGLGDSGRRTLNQSLIMEEVDDRYRGRVMSVYMMNFGLMPLGMLPAGLVSDWLGPQTAIGMLALLLLSTTAAVMASQSRLRNLE